MTEDWFDSGVGSVSARAGESRSMEKRLQRFLETSEKSGRALEALGERVHVRIGRRRVAIVPVEDLPRLEAYEDDEDVREVRAARAEAKRKGTIPSDQAKGALGLERSAHRTAGGDGADEEVAKQETACGPPVATASGRRVRVENGGRVVGILISEETFALFRRLLEAEEDRLDVVSARDVVREPGSVSLEELVDELGL